VSKKKSTLGDSYDEADFNSEVARCLLKVMGVRKPEATGDRVVRFLGLFLKSASEKDLVAFGRHADRQDSQVVPETPTSRLTFSLLSLLIPMLSVKEKTVRFRATQIIAHVINTLDSIDDELYHLIRQGLIKRIRDKESTIRIQAVMGLGRLAGNEAQDELGSDHSDSMDALGLLEKLLDALQHDTSAEVRRSLLLNLPITPATLPYLLERARDLDGATRRALYARLLPTLGDFRHLSLSMREKLLRWGLRDRDENVRKAAGRLFYERWIEDCAGNEEEDAEGGPVKAPSAANIQALLELLERIDVINSGGQTGIALEAMDDFWHGRPDYIDAVDFDEGFWNALTPESSFVARSFQRFCHQNERYQIVCEEKMPEVTRLGYYLQKYMNTLLESIKSTAELGGGEEETVEQEFVVEQLLHIALSLDYSDEAGRRKMFSLLREGLAMADLPEEITRLTVEVLRLVCGMDAAGEREFCSVVLEAIAEVHDNISAPTEVEGQEDESFVSARSEVSTENKSKTRQTSASPEGGVSAEEDEQKIIREIMINMKCIHITQCMLQNVDGNLQHNMHLVTMLNNLVVPAVRSHEAPIRERGLVCLGLCCLLDRSLAEENITLFIHCFSKGHENLQITALQILCDIITTHPDLLHDGSMDDHHHDGAEPTYQKPLFKCFTRALRPATSPASVQSAAATSLSKLLLTSRLNISPSALDDLLRTLVVSFFDPRAAENPALRQSLAYFIPVYVHSRLSNCQRMTRVAVPAIHEILKIADEHHTLEAEEDSDGEVDESAAEKKVKLLMGTVVGMLAEWTDGRKVVVLEQLGRSSGVILADPGTIADSANSQTQLPLAEALLERILGPACHGQERKCLLALLGKLYIPTSPATANTASAESHSILHEDAESGLALDQALALATNVKNLLDEAIADGVATDAAGKNGLVKIKNAVLKYLKTAAAATADAGPGRAGAMPGAKRARKSVLGNLGVGIDSRGGSAEEEDIEEQEDEEEGREDEEDLEEGGREQGGRRRHGKKEEEEEELTIETDDTKTTRRVKEEREDDAMGRPDQSVDQDLSAMTIATTRMMMESTELRGDSDDEL
jgi:condensin complex subunit 3